MRKVLVYIELFLKKIQFEEEKIFRRCRNICLPGSPEGLGDSRQAGGRL
jgi:hypothetical protein